jgi:hypothetical protein
LRLPPGLPTNGRWAGAADGESPAAGDGGRGGGLRVRVLGIRFLVVLHWSPDLEKEGVGERRRADGGGGSAGGGGEAALPRHRLGRD